MEVVCEFKRVCIRLLCFLQGFIFFRSLKCPGGRFLEMFVKNTLLSGSLSLYRVRGGIKSAEKSFKPLESQIKDSPRFRAILLAFFTIFIMRNHYKGVTMENEIETEETSFWLKTQDELTVGDNMKIAALVGAATFVIPLALIGVGAGIGVVVDKLRVRKNRRSFKIVDAKCR